MDTTALLLVVALAAPADSTVRATTNVEIAALVSAQVQPGDDLRVRGGFGQVQARASRIGPDGLDLLLAPRGLTEPAPVRSLTWSEIDRIERGLGHRKDGQRIGVVVGGFFGLALTKLWLSNADPGASPLTLVLLLAGGVGGAVLGRSAGGAVGAAIRRWTLVYERR